MRGKLATLLAVAALSSIAAAPAYAGDGTFTEAPGSPVPGATDDGKVLVGDFNRDGDPDIAATGAGNKILTFIGGAGASFAAGPTLTVSGPDVFDFAIGDFNEDGDQDLAALMQFQQPNSLIQTFNGADGTAWTGPAGVATIQLGFSIAVGDFNSAQNEDDDLLVGQAAPFEPNTEAKAQILVGGNGSSFTFGNATGLGQVIPSSIAVGQFQDTGLDDAAVLLPFAGQVRSLVGAGDSLFTEGTANAGSGSSGLAIGDFDLDDNDDIAVTNTGSDNVSILAGDSPDDGRFTPTGLLSTGPDPQTVAVGDFNSDGDNDLAIPTSGDDQLKVFLGAGGREFTPGASVPLSGDPDHVVAADFDGDGNQDLAISDGSGGGLHVLTGNGPAWDSGNLLQRGGAEGATGELYNELPVPPPWSGSMRYLRYGEVGPTLVTGQRWEGGMNYFWGGVTFMSATFNRSLTQVADVSANAADIDAGEASVRLRALLGGYRREEDMMAATATFLDGSGTSLGSFTIGPVTRADRDSRTILLPRAATSAVPASTRSISVRLDATQPGPDAVNRAMADNVSLKLQLPAPPPGSDPAVPAAADTTPPETTIDDGPPKKSEKSKAKLRYSADEPATFECKLKGASRGLREFSPCDGAKVKYKGLDPGKMKFQVRAIDAAGNVDPTPAKLTWKVLD